MEGGAEVGVGAVGRSGVVACSGVGFMERVVSFGISVGFVVLYAWVDSSVHPWIGLLIAFLGLLTYANGSDQTHTSTDSRRSQC